MFLAKTYKEFLHPKGYIDRVRRTSCTPCGYCHNARHRGLLNVVLLKSHRCVEKECPFLERYKTHSYWSQKPRGRKVK